MPEDLIELSHSDIDGAVSELAALTGVPVSDMWLAVREQANGERDVDSLARGVSLVADAIENTGFGLAAEPEGIEAYLSVSQAERDQAHEAGNSLDDKSYPINNVKQLRSAAILAASHHGNWQAARRLIRRRAKELGVSLDSLPGFGSSDSDSDEDDNDVAASYGIYNPDMVSEYISRHPGRTAPNGPPVGPQTGTIALSNVRDDGVLFDRTSPVDDYIIQLSADSGAAAGYFGLARSDNLPSQPSPPGTGDASDIAARNPHLFGSRSGRPEALDTTVPGGQGHKNCPPGCARDHSQPARGGQVHPEVQRYLDLWAAKMGNPERPSEKSRSYGPPTDAERVRASRRARPGHTGRHRP